jgi:hypothetical protein
MASLHIIWPRYLQQHQNSQSWPPPSLEIQSHVRTCTIFYTSQSQCWTTTDQELQHPAYRSSPRSCALTKGSQSTCTAPIHGHNFKSILFYVHHGKESKSPDGLLAAMNGERRHHVPPPNAFFLLTYVEHVKICRVVGVCGATRGLLITALHPIIIINSHYRSQTGNLTCTWVSGRRRRPGA